MLTTVTRAVLAAAAGLTLAAAAAPAASAQDDPVVPPPTTIVRAVAGCAQDGAADVTVILDDLGPYVVALSGLDRRPQETTLNEENEVHQTVFADVPVGEYVVSVTGHHEESDGVPVRVKPCATPAPSAPELAVEVDCRGGWGIATFVVTNPGTGESRTYTLNVVEEYQEYTVPDLFPGMFLRISENLYDDGVYTAKLSGDGLAEPVVREFTVDCAPKNQPSVFAYARCDTKEDVNSPAIVNVSIRNPNRDTVKYTVTSGDVSETVEVAAEWQETVELGPFPGGTYPVTVVGDNGTEAAAHVLVDYCEEVQPDQDGLQISVRCVGGESVVTARFFPVEPGRYTFKVEGMPEFDEVVVVGAEGRYQWVRFENSFADGAYVATLTGGELRTREEFAVDCVDGGPTTTTPPTTPVPPTTTTPGPPPQGSPGPVDGLPVTGAAVTGMAVLGLAALGLGAALVAAARRRGRA